MSPPRCGRCQSYDLHRSRLRGPLERFVLAPASITPRRCSACGWRGYRFGPAHPAPKAPKTEPVETPAERRHRRRHAHKVRSPLARKVRVVALAAFVGLGLGGAVYSCGTAGAAPVATE